MRSRVRLAALVAPPVVVLTVWLGYILTLGFLLGDEVAPAQIFDGAQLLLVYFLLFGLPLAYVGSALAIPIYYALQRRQQLRPGYVIGAAALMGALLVPLAWGVFWNRFEVGLAFLLPTGIAAGVAGGATFWWLGFRSASSHPPA
jgi:hypothetical protein